MVYLRYVGKKMPFKFENPKLKNPLEFNSYDDIVKVTDIEANWIFKFNPIGFVERVEQTRQNSSLEETGGVFDDKGAEAEEIFKCEFCGKEYKDKKWFDRHAPRCPEKQHEQPKDPAMSFQISS